MGKVAVWRPVRRGKNDRALTRYKSHYGVNLLDPSPPTDFQPPSTMLGCCRLWATSHANSDKVPLSPSRFLCLADSLSTPFFLSRSYSPSASTYTILVAFRLFRPIYLSRFFSLPPCLSLSGFIRQAIPTRGSQGHPNPHGRESQGISVPGTSAC